MNTDLLDYMNGYHDDMNFKVISYDNCYVNLSYGKILFMA